MPTSPSQGCCNPTPEVVVVDPLRYSCARRRLPFEVWKLGTSNIVPTLRREMGRYRIRHYIVPLFAAWAALLFVFKRRVSWGFHRLGGAVMVCCHMV